MRNIFDKIHILVKLCKDFFILHKILFCVGFNVFGVSTLKRKVRFYIGQELSLRKNVYLNKVKVILDRNSPVTHSPQPHINSTSAHPNPPFPNKARITPTELSRSSLPPNPTAALPSPVPVFPPGGGGRGTHRDRDQGQTIPWISI